VPNIHRDLLPLSTPISPILGFDHFRQNGNSASYDVSRTIRASAFTSRIASNLVGNMDHRGTPP